MSTVRRKGIGYLRVSSQGQESGLGLESQAASVREYAKTHKIQLLELVSETASGAVRQGKVSSHEHRPALRELIARAERKEYDLLIVARYDRLSRDGASMVMVKRLLLNAGVDLVSVAEENGDGPLAVMMQTIVGAVGQYDHSQILKRLKDGREEKRKQGGRGSGAVPYGYRSTRPKPKEGQPQDEKGSKLVVNEPTAAVVRRIFDLARKGVAPGKITQALNEDSIPSPAGKKWNRTTVRGIITNRIYRGELHGKKKQPIIVDRRRWNDANRALRARAK